MIIICDAGPLLHLHWVGAASWALPGGECLVPQSVWDEVARQDTGALQYAQLRRTPGPTRDPRLAAWRLDAGEAAALSLALSLTHPAEVLVLCDESQGRQACASLGVSCMGSVGLIVEAALADRVRIDAAEAALRALPNRGRCWVRREVIDAAAARIRSISVDGAP
jgi:predicted nucleic acid-binding protein